LVNFNLGEATLASLDGTRNDEIDGAASITTSIDVPEVRKERRAATFQTNWLVPIPYLGRSHGSSAS